MHVVAYGVTLFSHSSLLLVLHFLVCQYSPANNSCVTTADGDDIATRCHDVDASYSGPTLSPPLEEAADQDQASSSSSNSDMEQAADRFNEAISSSASTESNPIRSGHHEQEENFVEEQEVILSATDHGI